MNRSELRASGRTSLPSCQESRDFANQWKPIGITGKKKFSEYAIRFILCVGSAQRRVRNVRGSLAGRRVATTTPSHYAPRLAEILRREEADVVWCPTILTEFTDRTRANVDSGVHQIFDSGVSGIAFTSRAGITAFSVALGDRRLPENPFIIAALGRDAECLNELKMIDPSKSTVVSPAIATPSALVEALGEGKGRKILCPVPLVVDLEEPPVVSDFLQDLMYRGWIPVRVNAYITRWIGKDCDGVLGDGDIDALIFTSSAEVEGLIKSNWLMGNWRKRENRTFLVATHGPVTAAGAARLGIDVDVVGQRFESFSGVVEELATRLGCGRSVVL
ncbi:hypothetical protein R1flu_014606 [Riccia fluitans]|uniref:Tetrapyrrole biosynthesis uroporphyrinogen III synthase domain-containing protein n=1 Tax=Riccia fluitans TaxID=41844 RepID=A0ABD1YHA6_9MARC